MQIITIIIVMFFLGAERKRERKNFNLRKEVNELRNLNLLLSFEMLKENQT